MARFPVGVKKDEIMRAPNVTKIRPVVIASQAGVTGSIPRRMVSMPQSNRFSVSGSEHTSPSRSDVTSLRSRAQKLSCHDRSGTLAQNTRRGGVRLASVARCIFGSDQMKMPRRDGRGEKDHSAAVSRSGGVASREKSATALVSATTLVCFSPRRRTVTVRSSTSR